MKRNFFKHLMMFVAGVAGIGLLVWVVMLLWNAILPDLTGWKEIGYWQCAGLCVLFRLMTGHIGFSCRTKGCKRGKHHHWHERFNRKYRPGNGVEVEVCVEEKND